MTQPISRIDVVATVIYCKDRLLTVHNEKWGAFTLPMTKLRNWQCGLVEDTIRWELGHEAATRNVAQCLQRTSDRQPGLLIDVADLRQSDRSGQINHYQLQVYGFELDRQEPTPARGGEWLTRDDILDPSRVPISPTARKLIQALSEAALTREGRFPPAMRAAPMRASTSSIAIIGREKDGKTEWLCQWNDNWGRYFLVGGHRHRGEDAQACMARELKEELGVDADSDYTSRPRKVLAYADWSTSAWQMTQYDISTFDVVLAPDAVKRFEGNPANRWVSADEIRSERCADQRLISPTTRIILSKLGQLPA